MQLDRKRRAHGPREATAISTTFVSMQLLPFDQCLAFFFLLFPPIFYFLFFLFLFFVFVFVFICFIVAVVACMLSLFFSSIQYEENLTISPPPPPIFFQTKCCRSEGDNKVQLFSGTLSPLHSQGGDWYIRTVQYSVVCH